MEKLPNGFKWAATAAVLAQIVMSWLAGADIRHILLDLLIWVFVFFFAAVAIERFFHHQ